jgi:hypothetical protein
LVGIGLAGSLYIKAGNNTGAGPFAMLVNNWPHSGAPGAT